MGKADIGTAKYQSKQLKASGLQRLRFYCQICEKQCRDANGFKNHINSLSHQKKITSLKDGGSSIIEEYSSQFLNDFIKLLKINHGTKKINANKFYQEYILNDRDHVHMNSTKWSSLTQFVKFLGTKGYVKVEQPEADTDTEFNLVIRLIDTEYYQKQQELLQNQKNLKTEEQMSMKLINDQIKKGQEYMNRHKQEFKEESKPDNINTNQPIKVSLKLSVSKRPRVRSAFGNDSESEGEEEAEEEERGSQLKRRNNIKIGEITNRLGVKSKR